MVWSLALCPDTAKQDPVVYGAEFGVVFLAEGPRTSSTQKASIASAFTIRVLRQSATFGWSQSSLRYRLIRIDHARVHLAISTDMSGILVTAPPPPLFFSPLWDFFYYPLFPVPVLALHFGLGTWVQPSHPAPPIFRLRSKSSSYSQAPLLPPTFRGGTPVLVP